MKNLIIASLFSVAAVGGAQAAVDTHSLSATARFEIARFAPEADLSNLTLSQRTQIEGIFIQQGADSAGENVRGKLRTILGLN